MDGVHKLIVIYNGSQPIRSLDILIPLQKYFAIEILSLAPESLFSSYRLSIPVKIFENVKGMPGYLRGLEAFVKESDLVLVFGSYDVTSFQAARACQNQGVPFYVVTEPNAPFCKQVTAEQLALHQKMIGMAKRIFHFSEVAKEALKLEGIDDEKLVKLRAFYSTMYRSEDLNAAKRFRDYIGVGAEEILVLVQNLNTSENLRHILFSLRLISNKNNDLSQKIRLVLANCHFRDSEVDLACELGLTRQIMILNQSVDGFEYDLYKASGIAIECSDQRLPDTCNFWLIEAMKAGVFPIILGPSNLDEYADQLNMQVVKQVSDYQSLASKLEDLALRIGCDSSLRFQINAAEVFSSHAVGEIMAEAIFRDISTVGAKDAVVSKFESLCESIEQLISRSEWQRLEDIFTDCSDDSGLNRKEKARVACFKGQMYLQRSMFDHAIKSFESSLKDDSECWESLIGLAKISVISYLDEDAINYYRRAMAIKPNLAIAYEGLGFIHRRNDMFDEAIYWLSQALLLNPSNKKILLQLTQVCLETDQTELALKALEKVRSNLGDHASLLMAIGQIYLKTGRVEQGRKLVDYALELTAETNKAG